MRYRLTYDSGHGLVTWHKSGQELLAPNGMGSLLDYMLIEAEQRGTTIRLEAEPDEQSRLDNVGTRALD